MGLIDADALKEYCMRASKSDDDFRRVSLATLASVIDAQPTAYDPDKVVEQLKKEVKNIILVLGFTGNQKKCLRMKQSRL